MAIYHSTGDWRDIIVGKYLRTSNVRPLLGNEDMSDGSFIWNGIIKARPLANSKAVWKVGRGDKILF